MTEPTKNELVDELNKRLSVLKEKQNMLETEMRGYADRRDRLNSRISELRDEIVNLRIQRDNINSVVKEQKNRRNEMTSRIHGLIQEIRQFQEEGKKLTRKKPALSREALEKEVANIDWKIQTTPLTLSEDKAFVLKVKQLEIQLMVYKKIEQSASRVAQLQTEARTRKSESELLHKQLTENAQNSQETHQKMVERIENLRMLKNEANEMHSKFLQTNTSRKLVQTEVRNVLGNLRQLKGEIKQEVQKEKERNEDAVRQLLENKAKEKLKRGEKLSWEEFQLLAEKGTIEED